MTEIIWQDREIRFDSPKSQMELRKGEQLIENIGQIEDVKGNIGDIGNFTITNLRLMWYCKKSPKINLSIGYDCLLTVEVKINYSNVQGRIQILNLKGKFNNSRYEFIFQTINNEKEKAFQLFQTAYRTYESSKLYRDVKLRGALISKKQLVLLKDEKIINQYENSFNLSSNTNNSGAIILTNIRFFYQLINKILIDQFDILTKLKASIFLFHIYNQKLLKSVNLNKVLPQYQKLLAVSFSDLNMIILIIFKKKFQNYISIFQIILYLDVFKIAKVNIKHLKLLELIKKRNKNLLKAIIMKNQAIALIMLWKVIKILMRQIKKRMLILSLHQNQDQQLNNCQKIQHQQIYGKLLILKQQTNCSHAFSQDQRRQ